MCLTALLVCLGFKTVNTLVGVRKRRRSQPSVRRLPVTSSCPNSPSTLAFWLLRIFSYWFTHFLGWTSQACCAFPYSETAGTAFDFSHHKPPATALYFGLLPGHPSMFGVSLQELPMSQQINVVIQESTKIKNWGLTKEGHVMCFFKKAPPLL